MRHLTYTEAASYPVCLLVPTIKKDEIQKAYFDNTQVSSDDVLVMDLHLIGGKKKTPMAEIKRYITEELTQSFIDMGVQYVLCAESEYFKALTGSKKAEANLGYVMPMVGAGAPDVKVIYIPNYRSIFYDPPKVKAKIAQAMDALVAHASGTYQPPGIDIIHFADYPETDQQVEEWLEELLRMDVPLAIDIEAFSLKHVDAGIGTISLCWSKHEGIAFPVDYRPIEGATEAPYGEQVPNLNRRRMLRSFFERLKQKQLYHNIAYDVYVMIFQLFMVDLLDTKGLLHGMEVMLANWDDTKLVTYLATNSCAGNKLGLKDQSQEFTGNYAMEEIKDIRRIPLPTLLKYNLVDGLATWFTYEKQWATMVKDQQLDIYQNLFQPATKDIIQMQLTGLPVNMKRTLEVEGMLQADCDAALLAIHQSATVQRYNYRVKERYIEKKHAEWKQKRITLADVPADIVFNPNSGPQLQDLLFTFLGLPVLGLTDSKLPSTDGDTIKALQFHTADPDVKAFLKGLENYKAVAKILDSFIPAMKKAVLGPDGWHYLFGNFNLGGALSGRLSSNDPNLQNLPANTKYAKWIKSCFEAPPGWLFCGLDFASLEDRISALTTKDPNKLKVYTDGYDGHSLRAYAYFGEKMPDIENTVASINSIQKKYKSIRYDSKAPTFALTYQGTFKTLMTNCGFSEEVAKMIESRYHELYKVSDDWVAAKLNQAAKDGYVTVAFGLRVRTPLLHQVIRGNSKTPYEAEAEGRSAGNALGQSWCLLNSRASAEFMGVVRKGPNRLNIRPCAHIHDAQYMLVKDDPDVVLYANKHLVKAVEWQEHPDIAHNDVKLGGEFSIFYPTWVDEIVIPNGATEEKLFETIDTAMSSK